MESVHWKKRSLRNLVGKKIDGVGARQRYLGGGGDRL